MPLPISKKTIKRTVGASSPRKSKARVPGTSSRRYLSKPKTTGTGSTRDWEPMTVEEFEAVMKKHGAVKLTAAEARRYRKVLQPRV